MNWTCRKYRIRVPATEDVRFSLWVYRTKALLIKSVKGDQIEAACRWNRKTRRISILIAADNLRYLYLGHECFHAAFRYHDLNQDKYKGKIAPNTEELLADIAGFLWSGVHGITRRYGKYWG